MDLWLTYPQKAGGLEAVAQIHRAWPRVALVILTTYNDDELMLQALQAGARGYLSLSVSGRGPTFLDGLL